MILLLVYIKSCGINSSNDSDIQRITTCLFQRAARPYDSTINVALSHSELVHSRVTEFFKKVDFTRENFCIAGYISPNSVASTAVTSPYPLSTQSYPTYPTTQSSTPNFQYPGYPPYPAPATSQPVAYPPYSTPSSVSPSYPLQPNLNMNYNNAYTPTTTTSPLPVSSILSSIMKLALTLFYQELFIFVRDSFCTNLMVN